MTRSQRPDTLSNEIRRHFDAPVTTRFLRALPPFRVEPGMPDQLQELLTRLDQAEARQHDGQG